MKRLSGLQSNFKTWLGVVRRRLRRWRLRRFGGVLGRVDAPALVVSANDAVVVRGWAIDAVFGTPLAVRMRVGRTIIRPFAFSRPDVVQAFPHLQVHSDCGFWCELELPVGSHLIRVETFIGHRWTTIGLRLVHSRHRGASRRPINLTDYEARATMLARAEWSDIERHLRLHLQRPTFSVVICASDDRVAAGPPHLFDLTSRSWVLAPDAVLNLESFKARGAATDYVLLLDHGDIPAPDAFYRLAATATARPDVDLIYGDDWIVDHGRPLAIRAKPGWSPILFRSFDYIGSGVCVRTTAAAGVVFDDRYDLVMQLADRGAAVLHLRAFLTHAMPRKLTASIAPPAAPAPGRSVLTGEPSCHPSVIIVCFGDDEVFNDLCGRLEVQQGVDLRQVRCPAATPLPRLHERSPWSCLNQAARAARDDDILLFLERGWFLENDAIEHVAAILRDPALGAAGPRQLVGSRIRHGQTFSRGRWRPLLEPVSDEPSAEVLTTIRDVLGLAFEGLMIRASLFRALGGFQEAESLDAAAAGLCWAVRAAGYGVVSTPHRAVAVVKPGVRAACFWPGRPSRREVGLVDDPFYNDAVLSADPADFTTSFSGRIV